MRLGLTLGYAESEPRSQWVVQARAAEDLGYRVCWTSEAYGIDAVTVATWVAAHTSRIDVGTAVLQIPARTPAMTAMTAAGLDLLSGGRLRLGLGVSGPQVSEGWHGVRFDHPLARTREYVEIVRLALSRRTVRYDGEHWQLPLPDGPGKALTLSLQPLRAQLPIYLAAVGPRNTELTGRIADGWLGVFFAPEQAELTLDPLRRGRLAAATPTAPQTGTPDPATDPLAGFDVAVTVPVAVADDVAAAADLIRPHAALYLGGMGSRQQNFYNSQARRMGHEEAAHTVQELYLAGRPRDAAAAVPFDLIDATSLIGPPARIRDRLHAYAQAGVTTLSLSLQGSPAQKLGALRTVAEAADAAGLAR